MSNGVNHFYNEILIDDIIFILQLIYINQKQMTSVFILNPTLIIFEKQSPLNPTMLQPAKFLAS